MNVLLIGPRGSGKSSVGRRLAEQCGLRFVDLDDRVLGRFPEETVGAVWAAHGEPAWRDAEVVALREVLADDRQVVALGGGTPVIPRAREEIARARREGRVRVVYLKCSAAELERRLGSAPGDRPSLTGADPVGEIGAVLRAREPVYEASADVVHEGGAEDVEATVATVRAELAL